MWPLGPISENLLNSILLVDNFPFEVYYFGMLLNQNRTPVWAWDGKAESKCPCCQTPLIAKHPRDRVWHWAHKQHSNQEEGTCLFDESSWALRWRLGYFEFPGWEIEVPKKVQQAVHSINQPAMPPRIHLIMAMNPTTKQVREFVGKISDKHEARYAFLLGAQSHNVAWMFNGEEWASGRRRTIKNDGIVDVLKPKAQALYDRICAAKQGAMLHLDGKLYHEYVVKDSGKHTGIWYPLTGEKALAVLKNFNEATLPYANAESQAEAAVEAPPKRNPLESIQV